MKHKYVIPAVILLLLNILLGSNVYGQQSLQVFRIGTSSPDSVSFLIAKTLSPILSRPIGAPSCSEGGVCGINGLLVESETFSSLEDAFYALQNKHIDSLLFPATLLNEALHTHPEILSTLRILTSFSVGAAHLIIAKDLLEVISDKSIPLSFSLDKTIRPLFDKSQNQNNEAAVALQEIVVSGLINHNTVFAANDKKEIDIVYDKNSIDSLVHHSVDGWMHHKPMLYKNYLTANDERKSILLNLDEALFEKLKQEFPFIVKKTIASNTYKDQTKPINTFTIPTLWLVRKTYNPVMVKSIINFLNSEKNLKTMQQHSKMAEPFTFIDNVEIAIPQHPALD